MAAPRAILLAAQVQSMKIRYEERDSRGRRMNSIIQIAKEFGVSETTVYRAIHSFGAYMAAPEPLSEGGVPASLERLQAAMRKELDAGGLKESAANALLEGLGQVDKALGGVAPVVPIGQIEGGPKAIPGDAGYE